MKFEQLRQEFLKEAKVRRRELEVEQSECDMMLCDAMHFLENERCDAVAMVKAAKRIKEIRQKRRKVKIEMEKLQSIKDSMTKGMAKFDKKTYTYRTEVMNDISNKSMKG